MQEGVWLLQGAAVLAELTENGWPSEAAIASLRLLAQGVQGIPELSRCQIFRTGAVLSSGSFLPTEGRLSEEACFRLGYILSENIATGWKHFLSMSTSQALAIGQAQLFLLQHVHTLLPPPVRPFLYTGVYGLIGMALHFQERHEEALRAHQSSYLAALASGDPLYVGESLICQADCYRALGCYDADLQMIQEALRLIGDPTEEAAKRIKAHVFTCWADHAMTLQQPDLSQEKLDESAEGIEGLSAHEAFDHAGWLLLAGKHALLMHRNMEAMQAFQQALAELPDHWTLRRVMTGIGLAMAYARLKEREHSFAVAEALVPQVQVVRAPRVYKWFADYLLQDVLASYPTDSRGRRFVADVCGSIPEMSLYVDNVGS